MLPKAEAIRVLLADDHAVVREGLRNALRSLDSMEVVAEVGDGSELLKILDELDLDLILLDITMPHFDPFEGIKHIKERYPNLLILVVSAFDDDVYVQGMLNAGVNGYHLKDQPLSDLRLAIKRVLEGQRWISGPLVETLLRGPKTPLPVLTKRQQDILQCLVQGYDNRAIAHELGLSIKTVENHLTRLYRQLEVKSRLEAVNYVHEHPEIFPELARAPEVEDIDLPAPGQGALLIVDDNSRYRYHMRRMMVKFAPTAKVYEASSVEEAVGIAREVIPQLTLIDVILQDEDGIDCAQQILEIHPNIPLVLISAYPEFRQRALEAGVFAFLDKRDLDINALRELLLDVIDG